MAEGKNVDFDRPGGYAMPSGATSVQRRAAGEMTTADIRLLGDRVAPYSPSEDGLFEAALNPAHQADDPDTRVYIGDCREVLPRLPDRGAVDLVFADPPFNWEVPYEEWNDGMPRAEYERFTFDWLDACVDVLSPTGSLWVNIPDDTVAEIVVHLKRRGLTMINWCVWHFRFGQHRESSFIMSKVHALYFAKDGKERTWNPDAILEPSDRATVYFDERTMAKDSNKGMRVPMDVWYGQYWGRIQGNNKERRHRHHNQIPARDPRVLERGRPRARSVSRQRHHRHRGPRVGTPVGRRRILRGQCGQRVGSNRQRRHGAQGREPREVVGDLQGASREAEGVFRRLTPRGG